MKTLKIVCVVLGLLHAGIMTAFALGPELSSLMVLIVDAPVAHFTQDLAPPLLQMGIPILVCSFLYPGVVFLGGVMILRLMKKTPSVSST